MCSRPTHTHWPPFSFLSMQIFLISQSHGGNLMHRHRHGQDILLKFTLSIIMRKKADLMAWLVVTNRLVKLLIYWDFHTQSSFLI